MERLSANALLHTVDLQAPPGPAGQILPGSTWSFQAWFRDPAGGSAGFQFSSALRVRFAP